MVFKAMRLVMLIHGGSVDREKRRGPRTEPKDTPTLRQQGRENPSKETEKKQTVS